MVTSIRADMIGRYLATVGELSKYTCLANPRFNLDNKIAEDIKKVL